MTQTFDELQMLFGDDYVINEFITIHQPTIGDIVQMGEQEYFQMTTPFTTIPSDMKAQLWEKGIDWMELSDFELFIMLIRGLKPESTKILFGDSIDFTKFDLYLNKQNNMLFLQDPNGVKIDVNIYNLMSKYIRDMHGIVPKIERAYNNTTKKVMIREAQMLLRNHRNKPYKSMFRNMISSMVNSAGFKYDYQSIRELGIVAFMDAVKRIQCISNANSLLLGCYMGNVDMKKIDKKQLDWMRELK